MQGNSLQDLRWQLLPLLKKKKKTKEGGAALLIAILDFSHRIATGYRIATGLKK